MMGYPGMRRCVLCLLTVFLTCVVAWKSRIIRESSSKYWRFPPFSAPGYFTVYAEYFNSGLLIPPSPLLVELLQNLRVSFSQLTPNALLCFFGFCHRVSAIGLVPSVELFHALFSARCTKSESDIFFQPRPKCRFLRKLRSYRGDWKLNFFYVKDSGWGVPVEWSFGLSIIKLRGCFLKFMS